jgi:hypothetical protein
MAVHSAPPEVPTVYFGSSPPLAKKTYVEMGPIGDPVPQPKQIVDRTTSPPALPEDDEPKRPPPPSVATAIPEKDRQTVMAFTDLRWEEAGRLLAEHKSAGIAINAHFEEQERHK